MIDRLRVFLHRPLADADRARLFVVAVAAILLGAAALALIDSPPAREATRHPAPPTADRAAAEPATAQEATLEPLSEEGNPPVAAEVSRGDVDAARAAARRFLAAYLPYSYGQTTPRAIEGASDELRDRLEAEPPRVPEAERRRRPRVLLVQADGVGKLRAAILALVGDGARRYTIRLELERRRSGWRVTNVGS